MTIEQRLERLETQNRWLKGEFVFIVVVLIAGAIWNQLHVPALVQARAFHVLGDDGDAIVRIEGLDLNTTGTFGTVVVLSAKGEPLVGLGETPKGGGGITTFNGHGQPLVVVARTANRHGVMMVYNDTGQELVRLGSTDDGVYGAIATYNDLGDDLVRVSGQGSTGAVTTFGENGHFLAQMGIGDGGVGTLRTFDDQGGELVVIDASAGAGRIAAHDPAGVLETVTLEPKGP